MSIMSILVASGAKGRVSLAYTFSASTQNASLNVTSLSGYSAGKSDITVTVNSGVYLWSSVITTPGLTLTGGTTGDKITLVNNGFIMGKGGNGLTGTSPTTRIEAQSGGSAISTSLPITITNTAGYIGGGGGGGGGFWYYTSGSEHSLTGGGGGAGGGTGGNLVQPSQTVSGGAGGTIGSSGVTSTATFVGSSPPLQATVGGGGGRILPGTTTTLTLTGDATNAQARNGLGGTAGGTGGIYDLKTSYVYTAVGGGPGQAGSVATTNPAPDILNYVVGGGGGWGAAGSNSTPSDYTVTMPGAGGKAVALNGNTITWTGGAASSSRAYGAVS